MTTEEFSNEFDILLNSFVLLNRLEIQNKVGTIEVDEYEKSVFLTKAQEELVLQYYTNKNNFRESFESTEEMRQNLSSLIRTYSTSSKLEGKEGLTPGSVFFDLPENLWFITYESLTIEESDTLCFGGKSIIVVPTTQDEFYRINNNPFKGSNRNRALRLDHSDHVVEIISKYPVDEYLIRYITKLDPIILTDLEDGLTINGYAKLSPGSLNSNMHRAILDRAVQLALISKTQLTTKQ